MSKFINLLHRPRSSKYANFYLAGVFFITIFLQCCFFHWQAFSSILVSSLWNNPLSFLAFYVPKISISLLFASFVFLFRRKNWTIVISLLINFWIMTELIYYRANRIFLDAHSFTLIGNMDGFWTSVPMYIYFSDAILLLPTFLLSIALVLFSNNSKSLSSFIIFIMIAACGNVSGCLLEKYVYQHANNKNYLNPFLDRVSGMYSTTLRYIQNTSVIHAFVYNAKKLIKMPFDSDTYVINEEDERLIAQFINDNEDNPTPNHNLYLIIVESLETWAIRPEITPNLWDFIHKNEVLWAQKVVSQTKGGISSDGQLIFNTGLLPIQDGAVAKRFPHNTFPSLSALYQNAALIQPGELSVWNQKYMSDAYQIDTNYLSPQSLDHVTFSIFDSIYYKHPYCMTITMGSHSPFLTCSQMTSMDLPEGMPTNMANYLRCLNYTDSCMGQFLEKVTKDSILRNSTICIMGDHIIFGSDMRNDFIKYCFDNKLDYDVSSAYTALIAYSPSIDKSHIIDDTTFQMDAYPTLLHLLGCNNYWKGFGVNLLDSISRYDRLITEDEAYALSDKIIRSNYFQDLIK